MVASATTGFTVGQFGMQQMMMQQNMAMMMGMMNPMMMMNQMMMMGMMNPFGMMASAAMPMMMNAMSGTATDTAALPSNVQPAVMTVHAPTHDTRSFVEEVFEDEPQQEVTVTGVSAHEEPSHEEADWQANWNYSADDDSVDSSSISHDVPPLQGTVRAFIDCTQSFQQHQDDFAAEFTQPSNGASI